MSEANKIPKGYVRCCKVIGNGDFRQGRELMESLAARLEHARGKHPVFARGISPALEVISAEHAEMVQAVAYEGEGRARDECLDVLATAVRFANGEWERG